jgi:oligopeptide/dipeptide ABC transporter ATP-binding protein
VSAPTTTVAAQVALEVRDLTVEIAPKHRQAITPVRGISFDVVKGHRLGIVGESGSGKSITALSLIRLLPLTARIAAGSVRLRGRDLVSLPEKEMTSVRGGQLSIVYQDPMSSLNPLHSVGRQIVEAIRTHRDVSRGEAHDLAVELMRDVGIPHPERRIRNYPHEFSGGMRQRVMIAMAICADPDVLIADEPTTALDVTTQARIMDLLSRIVDERQMGVILITHDLGLAASFCDHVHVMYAGRIVESGPSSSVLLSPAHPYSEALLESICGLDRDVDMPIAAIAGQPPVPQELPAGCSFHPRCRYAQRVCATDPPVPAPVRGHAVECFFPIGGRA